MVESYPLADYSNEQEANDDEKRGRRKHVLNHRTEGEKRIDERFSTILELIKNINERLDGMHDSFIKFDNKMKEVVRDLHDLIEMLYDKKILTKKDLERIYQRR